MDIKNIDPAQLAWLVSGRHSSNLADAAFKNNTLRDVFTTILRMMYANAMLKKLKDKGSPLSF